MEEKKKRINSKSKGQSNERKIAKILSDNLAPLKFIRTPGSGAFVGGKNFAVRQHLFSDEVMQTFLGDIVSTNETEVGYKFRWVVECKHYKNPDSFESLFTGKNMMYGWLEEVNIDCVKVGKPGIVICKWNNTKYYCIVKNEIELPCRFMILPTGDKVCLFDELLQYKDFWIEKV